MRWEAVLGGLVGGGIAFGVGIYLTSKHLEERGQLLQQGLTGQGTGMQALMVLQGEQIHRELEASGNTLAQGVALQTAQALLASEYHLTPTTMLRLATLSRRLGV